MKGVIALCLKEMVCKNFGQDKWDSACHGAGMKGNELILPLSDVDDKAVLTLVNEVCGVLGINLQQAADAFGDYWVNVYSQKMYKSYFKNKTAREFLLDMDKVHIMVTKEMKNAHPPRFTFEWEDPNTLKMNYLSERGLVDFLVGLVKGVGKYYNEPLVVNKVSDSAVRVKFN